MWKVAKIIGEFFMDIIETGVFALSIFLIIYVFFAQPHQVSGRSMVPNFQDGEFLLTNKLAYRTGEPERGDVVIFRAPPTAHCTPGGACDFIKRVIGLPGETIGLSESSIIINGQRLVEDYLPIEFKTRGGAFMKEGMRITLALDEYFVLGDNRPGSSDSRSFGPIKRDSFIGKAWIRYWPLNEVGVLEPVVY